MRKEIKKDLIYIGLLFIIFCIWTVLNFPKDLGDSGISWFHFDSLLTSAKDSGESVYKLMNQDKFYRSSYFSGIFEPPLETMFTHLVTLIFGLSPYSGPIFVVFSAFATIVISYYLGSLLYGRFFGIIFGILMCTDVYFNVNMRTGTPHRFLNAILLLFPLFFFLRAHLKKEEASGNKSGAWGTMGWIALASFFFMLCFLHGYPETFLILPFLLMFLGILILTKILSCFKLVKQAYQKYRLLNIGYYLAFIFLAVFFYFGFTLLWDNYTGAPYLYTHKAIINANVARVSFGAERSVDFFEFGNRLSKLLEVVFIDMDKNFLFANGGVHSDTAFSGYPLIPIFSSIFFITGLVFIFKKRRQNDLLLLLFLLFSFLVIIFVFQPYAIRIFIFLTPFLLFISCIGYVETFQFVRNKFLPDFAGNRPGRTEAIFLSIVLLLNIPNYFSINKTFVTERNGYKIWYVGQAQIYDYLKKENVNEKSLVVFGIRDVYTWLNMLYINRHKIKPVFYDLDKEIQEDFKQWKDKQFKDYDTIYLIFPSECIFITNPGLNFSSLSMRSFTYKFHSAVPSLQLVKTIYSNNGIPIHYIYKMNKKSELNGKTVYLSMAKNDVSEFKTNNAYSVERLYVQGPATAIIFENGEEKKRMTLNLTSNMDVLMDFDKGEGLLQFYPNFDNKEETFENVYDTIVPLDTGRSSIQLKEGRGGFGWLEIAQGFWYGEIIFNIKSPSTVKRLDIRTNPRLFNDIYGKNRFDAYYSKDGSHYKRVFSLRSNKNERFGNSPLAGIGGDRYSEPDWQGFEEYATYDSIYPDSKSSYIKFRFQTPWSGYHSVDLISHLKTMFFKATLNISTIKIPIVRESTKVYIVRADDMDKENRVAIVLKDRSIQDVQERLLDRGYVIGTSDSEPGGETKEAIKRFQKDNRLKITGELDDKTKRRMVSLFYKKYKGGIEDIPGNPGFEKWVKVADTGARIQNTKILNGWIVGGDGVLFADRVDKLEGDFSARLNGAPGGYSNINIFKRDEMEKVGGKKITFSADVKTGTPRAGQLRFTECTKDGKKFKEVYSKFHSGNNEWERLTVSLTASGDIAKSVGYLQVLVHNRNGSPNNFILIDKARLSVTEDDGKEQELVLGNSGFEKWTDIAVDANVKGQKVPLYGHTLLPLGWSKSGIGKADREKINKMEGDYAVKIRGESNSQLNLTHRVKEGVEELAGKEVVFGACINGVISKAVQLCIKETYSEDSSVPKGWIIGGDGIGFLEQAVKREGERAFKLSGAADTWANINQVNRDWAGDLTGDTIIFSGDVKTDIPKIGRLRLSIYYKDKKLGEATSDFHPGDNQWQPLSVSLKIDTAVDAIQAAFLNTSSSSNEYIYVDNAILKIAGESIELPLKNGGFEEGAAFSKKVNLYTEVLSDYYSGSGKWENLKVSKNISNSPESVELSINSFGEDWLYVDNASITVAGETEELDKKIDSNRLNLADAQKILLGLGYDIGDHVTGASKDTQYAIRRFQADNNLKTTGLIDDGTRDKLGLATGRKVKESKAVIKNILTNGGFENWANNGYNQFAPSGWNIGGGAVASKEEQEKYEGNFSVKMSGATGGEANINHPLYEVDQLKDKRINLTVNIKANKGKIVRLRLTEVAKGGTVKEAYSDFHPGNGEWKELSVSKLIGNSVEMVQFVIFNQSASSEDIIYADDAVLSIGKKETVIDLDKI